MPTNEEQQQDSGKSYYIGGNVGSGATVIMGEHIQNIQQFFPQTDDGVFLSKSFSALVQEIGGDKTLDDDTRDLAMGKTTAVADGLANSSQSPGKLRRALIDAKGFLLTSVSWAWDKMIEILESDAAQKTIGTITDAAIQATIKSAIGGP